VRPSYLLRRRFGSHKIGSAHRVNMEGEKRPDAERRCDRNHAHEVDIAWLKCKTCPGFVQRRCDNCPKWVREKAFKRHECNVALREKVGDGVPDSGKEEDGKDSSSGEGGSDEEKEQQKRPRSLRSKKEMALFDPLQLELEHMAGRKKRKSESDAKLGKAPEPVVPPAPPKRKVGRPKKARNGVAAKKPAASPKRKAVAPKSKPRVARPSLMAQSKERGNDGGRNAAPSPSKKTRTEGAGVAPSPARAAPTTAAAAVAQLLGDEKVEPKELHDLPEDLWQDMLKGQKIGVRHALRRMAGRK
jgi:hypothetical protein